MTTKNVTYWAVLMHNSEGMSLSKGYKYVLTSTISGEDLAQKMQRKIIEKHHLPLSKIVYTFSGFDLNILPPGVKVESEELPEKKRDDMKLDTKMDGVPLINGSRVYSILRGWGEVVGDHPRAAGTGFPVFVKFDSGITRYFSLDFKEFGNTRIRTLFWGVPEEIKPPPGPREVKRYDWFCQEHSYSPDGHTKPVAGGIHRRCGATEEEAELILRPVFKTVQKIDNTEKVSWE